MEIVTACTMDCPDACSIVLSQDGARSVRLRGNPAHPITAGLICAKIKKHVRRIESSDRITTPLLRKNGDFQPIPWEEALGRCAAAFDRHRQEPLSILHIQGSGAKGVLKESVKLFFNQLGSSHMRGSLCDAAGLIAYAKDFGSRENHGVEDILNAARIVNWGQDLRRSSIHLAALVQRARKQGARLLTIAPDRRDHMPPADHLIRLRPGTDRFLAAAAIRRLMAAQAVPPQVQARIRKWPAFAQHIRGLSESDLLAQCDAAPEDLERLLGWYRREPATATLVGSGLQRYDQGGENARYINALALCAGHIGRRGGGSYYHLNSLQNLNLGWIKAARPRGSRSLLEPLVGRETLAARQPEIEMIWVNGINIVNQAPNSHQVARALKAAPFTVVVDAFMTDTAACADLILPAALMLEQEDIIGSFLHEYVHFVPAALAPPAGVRDDYALIREVARRLDPPLELPDADTCLARSLESPYLDISLEQLRRQHFVRSKRPRIAYRNLQFDHADGRARCPLNLTPEAPPPPDYPLRLLSLIRGNAIHSQMLPQDQTSLPAAWVAPECAALGQIDRSRSVYLVSPLGRLRVDLKLRPGLHPQCVLYRRGDWMGLGGGVNQLIREETTDMGSGTPYYRQYIRLEN